ncbi:MAG: metallopeptidase family protein [Bryobacteraceae bacterium]|nr:metallopeptidase family protein [Bryobacteraceae bacterium]MDW8379243.1 metallopeptidase family protein [Bryobacterales bacterium]
MTPKKFDALVERALRQIPARFRKRLKNLVFVVEQEPPSPGLLGLYEGRPLIYRSVTEPVALPDRITIYQGPHERLARDEEELRDLVAETVWHEIAHYFGLEENEVLRAERKRRLVKRAASWRQKPRY